MPLTKYYCDYCDKQFQDTPSARRRHLQGLQHQRARALWYDSFKDPHQIQSQGLGRGVCNYFVRTGFCQYGDACKYFHPKQNIQYPNQAIPGGNIVKEYPGMSFENLPPSLRPPPEGGYPQLPFIDWG